MSQDSNQHRIDALRHQWRVDPTPRRTLELAEEHRRAGEYEVAIEVLRSGLEKHPGHVASRVALGRFLLESGRPGEASQALEQITAEDQTHLVANKLLVESYLQLGQAPEARDRLDLYTLLNGSDTDIEEFEARLDALSAGAVVEPEAEAPTFEVERPSFGEPGADPVPELPAATSSTVDSEDPFLDVWSRIERTADRESADTESIFDLGLRPGVALELPAGEPDLPGPVLTEAEPPTEIEPTDIEPTDEVAEATVTLGRLYLEQGHHAEATRVFREVLAREPGNQAAKAGLDAAESGTGGAITASDLLAADELRHGPVIERKRMLLTAYLARLKPAAAGA